MADESIGVTAQGDGATLTLILRAGGTTIAQAGSVGGTSELAMVAGYLAAAGSAEVEVRRTDKAGAPADVRLEITEQQRPPARDIAIAAGYRALLSAKTPADFEGVVRDAIAQHAPMLATSAALGEIRSLFSSGKYQAGFDAAESRLPLAHSFPDAAVEGQLRYLQGLCDLMMERYSEAAGHLSAAIGLQRPLHQPYELAASLHNLATAHQVLGDCRDAVTEAEAAFAIRRTLGDPHHQAISQLVVAKANVCLGPAQAALDNYQALIPQWRELKDGANEAVA